MPQEELIEEIFKIVKVQMESIMIMKTLKKGISRDAQEERGQILSKRVLEEAEVGAMPEDKVGEKWVKVVIMIR